MQTPAADYGQLLARHIHGSFCDVVLRHSSIGVVSWDLGFLLYLWVIQRVILDVSTTPIENEARITSSGAQVERINTSRERTEWSFWVPQWLEIQFYSGLKSTSWLCFNINLIMKPVRWYFSLFWVPGSSLILASFLMDIVAILSHS